MNAEELEAIRAAWTGGDAGEDAELKACWLTLDSAGKWSLSFRNQGFDPVQFGDDSLLDYVSSPDVAYYDGSLKLGARSAYGALLMARDLRDEEGFRALDAAVRMFFDALLDRDAQTASDHVKAFDASTGSVTFDANEITKSLLFDLTVEPAR